MKMAKFDPLDNLSDLHNTNMWKETMGQSEYNTNQQVI